LDEADTARRSARFYAGFAQRVEGESALLSRLGASAVVGDIPPLAFAAASRADIPSVALGNFTWDWIYSGSSAFRELAPGVVEVIGDAYAKATRALRLPFHGGFGTMAGITRDVPLIARRAARQRVDVRRALGIAADAVVVLASFGGYGLQLPYEDIARASPFTLVVTDREVQGSVARQDFHYPDIVAAADVVVSKPGYGIVSECIANGAALLYTDRGRFPEHDVFVAEMPRVLRCRFIPQEDLLAGRWSDAIDALLGQPPPPERLDTNGADVAAEQILGILD
jgi:L-arabinokinase